MLADSEVKGSEIVRAEKWGTVRFAQMILDEQGYIILGASEEESIGSTLPRDRSVPIFGVEPDRLGPLIVIGKATRKEFVAQVQMFYPEHVPAVGPTIFKHYYKVTAE